MQVLYEDKVMIISWDNRNRIIEQVWKGFASGETYRNPLEKLLGFMRSKRVSKVLSDMCNLGAVAQSDQNWTETYFAPNAIAAGVKYWALVLPASVIGQMGQRSMQETIDETLKPPYEQFNTASIEEGRIWLRNCP